MKKCGKCGSEKILNDFHNNKSKIDGKATECKACKKKQDDIYRLKNIERCKVYAKQYRQDNKQVLNEKKKIYIIDNKIDFQKRQHLWYERNKDKRKAEIVKYKKEHPDQYRMYASCRRARKKGATVTRFSVKDIVDKYGEICFYCKGSFEQIDHYIPLSKDGLHTLENVRPSCAQCNLEKSNKLPEDFLKYKGIKNE